MKSFGRLVLATSALVLSGGVASAADMMAAEYVDTAVPAMSGFYGTLHGGFYMPQDPDLTIVGAVRRQAAPVPTMAIGSADRSATISMPISVSKQKFPMPRPISIRSNFASVLVPDTDGDGSSLTLMGNLIVGQHFGAWRPYVGAGAGAARLSLN